MRTQKAGIRHDFLKLRESLRVVTWLVGLLLAAPPIRAQLPPSDTTSASVDKGMIDLVLSSEDGKQLEAHFQSPTSPLNAKAARLISIGDEEVWRIQVDEGLADREAFLARHLGSATQVLGMTVYPAVNVSLSDVDEKLPPALATMEAGLAAITGEVPVRGHLNVEALHLVAAQAAQWGAAPSERTVWSATLAMSPSVSFPPIVRAAPPSFVVDLAGEQRLAIVTIAEQHGAAWTVEAKLTGEESGTLQLYLGDDGVSAFGQTPTRGYLMSTTASGRAVSVSFPTEAPDHPTADSTDATNTDETATFRAAEDAARTKAAASAQGQNACQMAFTNAIDLKQVPSVNTVVTIDVLFVAEANAGFMLDFTQPMLELLNQSVRSSGVPVTFRQVHKFQSSYRQPCSSTDDCWYQICDDLVTGRGPLQDAHALRDEKKADVVVLLVQDMHFRGLAADIGASADRAFLILGPAGVPHHSLGHEITHLAGGLHNQECESKKAFPRHGYVRSDRMGGTVMATTCTAHKFLGLRLPYWSSANRVFPDGTSMGAEGCCDESGVLASGALRLSQFR